MFEWEYYCNKYIEVRFDEKYIKKRCISIYKILAINPGNTSTKIGLFKDKELISSEVIRYGKGELVKFKKIIDQLDFRLKSIDYFIQKNNIDLSEIDFFIGRGGYLKPLKSGLYEINSKMVEDLRETKYGEHSSNLGAIIAYSYACEYKKKSYILDPICVDELEPVARISGHPAIERKSIFHALNQKKVAMIASLCKDLGPLASNPSSHLQLVRMIQL